MNSKGIVVFAFGKNGYAYAAFNLGMSLSAHSPTIQKTIFINEKLLHEVGIDSFKMFYNDVVLLPEDSYVENGKVDPAKLKCDLYNLLPYEQNLYLDADSLCVRPIDDLFESLCGREDFYTTYVFDKGGRNDEIQYSLWASNDDIWEFFGLPDTATLPAVQSSWAYIRKCEEAIPFFEAVKKNRSFPLDKLKTRWGGTLADELIYSGTCAQFGLIPSYPNQAHVMFFGNTFNIKTIGELQSKFYFLSIYGNGKGNTLTKRRYLEMYDRMVLDMGRKAGLRDCYRQHYIMRDKHLNKH